MNKAVTKILTHLVRQAMKDPKVRSHAEDIAKAASEKAVEVAKVVYAGASEWLRERRSKMEASNAENRRAPARKKTARKSVAKKSAAPAKKPPGRKSAAKETAGKKTPVRTKRPKSESPPDG
jgi:hypothetical protein